MLTDLERYKYELNRYYTLMNKISDMLPLLENSKNTYEEIIKALSNEYIIDSDTTNVYDKSVEIKDKIEETSKQLKNNILPGINSKIYLLKKEISECEEND